MAVVLQVLAYVGLFSALIMVTLALACGLYYLSEQVDEHTVLAARAIRWLTWTVVALHLALLLIDGLPFLRVLFSLATLAMFSTNMFSFPCIQITSVRFISSVLMAVANHFVWFNYFTTFPATLLQVAAFFGICVWSVPFAYFISLSVSETSLPTFESGAVGSDGKRRRVGLIKSVIDVLTGRGASATGTSSVLPSGVNFRKEF